MNETINRLGNFSENEKKKKKNFLHVPGHTVKDSSVHIIPKRKGKIVFVIFNLNISEMTVLFGLHH